MPFFEFGHLYLITSYPQSVRSWRVMLSPEKSFFCQHHPVRNIAPFKTDCSKVCIVSYSYSWFLHTCLRCAVSLSPLDCMLLTPNFDVDNMRLSDFIGRPYQKSILSLFSRSYFIILEGYVEYCSLIWLSSKTTWSIQWFQQWLWCPCSGVILRNAEWSFSTGIFSSGSFFYLFIFFLLPFVNGKQLPLLSCKWDQFFLSSSLSCPIYQIQLTVTMHAASCFSVSLLELQALSVHLLPSGGPGGSCPPVCSFPASHGLPLPSL